MRIKLALLIALTISIELIEAGSGKRKKNRDESRKTESKAQEMDSMICPPCDRLFCTVKKESRLKCNGGGTTTDICGCCPVCAKHEKEPCGGEWNYLGKCDRGLYCRAATISLLQTDTFYPQIKTEVPMGGMPEGTCVKQPNIIQDPPDSSSSEIQTLQQGPPAKCQPRCTPDFCLKNPREICSAVDVVDLKRECHGSCQHTSCQACSWVDPDPDCGACASDDFRCIKRFAKCIKRNFCSRQKFPCKQIGDNDHIGKFQCMVPKCLDKS